MALQLTEACQDCDLFLKGGGSGAQLKRAAEHSLKPHWDQTQPPPESGGGGQFVNKGYKTDDLQQHKWGKNVFDFVDDRMQQVGTGER